jgi:hypothetical protein
MISRTWKTEARWLTEPDLSAWVANSRLNLLRALADHATEPPAQTAINRYLTHIGLATQNLTQLHTSLSSGPQPRPRGTVSGHAMSTTERRPR